MIIDGAYVEGMSGMTCVIPAWQIMEVLDMPQLKGPRDAIFAADRAEREKKNSAPKPEGLPVSPSSDDANPNHLADFTRLVDVAARKRPQGD